MSLFHSGNFDKLLDKATRTDCKSRDADEAAATETAVWLAGALGAFPAEPVHWAPFPPNIALSGGLFGTYPYAQHMMLPHSPPAQMGLPGGPPHDSLTPQSLPHNPVQQQCQIAPPGGQIAAQGQMPPHGQIPPHGQMAPRWPLMSPPPLNHF
ncbi:hypothetical protein JTB14_022696 [Gonioctena quinquepunctata]|nr:hypothetical protein JTB14_022696 [Gonioctena quinquepunctata]